MGYSRTFLSIKYKNVLGLSHSTIIAVTNCGISVNLSYAHLISEQLNSFTPSLVTAEDTFTCTRSLLTKLKAASSQYFEVPNVRKPLDHLIPTSWGQEVQFSSACNPSWQQPQSAYGSGQHLAHPPSMALKIYNATIITKSLWILDLPHPSGEASWKNTADEHEITSGKIDISLSPCQYAAVSD